MALITCPECGFEVSNQAFSCPRCGYPIKATIASDSTLTPSEQRAHSEKKRYGKIILLSLILVFIVVCILVYRNNSSLINSWFQSNKNPINLSSGSNYQYVPTEHILNLLEGSIVAEANEQYRHIDFSTIAGSTNNQVVGRFQAYGGSGNDIRIMIMTQDDYTNFINGHSANTYYNSGKVTVDNLSVRLPSGYGTYTLVFDNYFSITTGKEIHGNIRLVRSQSHC